MKKLLVLIAILGVATFSINTASAGVGVKSVGMNVGWVSPQDVDGTWTVGASLDLGLPMVNLSFSPFVNYWSRSETLLGIDANFSDVEFGGTAKLAIPTAHPSITPIICAGV
jgi:hypothetical protein